MKKKWQFLTGCGRTGLAEKVSLDQSLKGSKGPSYTGIWGKSIQTSTASAKALRWHMAGWESVEGSAEGNKALEVLEDDQIGQDLAGHHKDFSFYPE